MAPFDFFSILFAVIVANYLDRRWKLGEWFFEKLIPGIFHRWLSVTKRYFGFMRKHQLRSWFLFLSLTFLISLPFLSAPNASVWQTLIFAPIAAFYILGFCHSDEQRRKNRDHTTAARAAKVVKATKKKELEKKKNIDKPTYKAWDVLVAVPLDLTWQYFKLLMWRVFFVLSRFYPFSSFAQDRKGHYRNRMVTALAHIFEQETEKDGFPSEVVNYEAADQFYVLQFVLLKDVKVNITDKFLRDIEFRFGLDQQSLFLRKNEELNTKIYNFDVIVPREAAKQLV